MRIDPSSHYLGNTPSEGVANTQGQPKIPSSQVPSGIAPESAATDSGDTVQFSGNLTETQELKAKLAQVPEIRADRVAALQQQVQQGTYKPSSEAIASAMVADLSTGGQR